MTLNAPMTLKRFEAPFEASDELRSFPKGKCEIVRLGGACANKVCTE